MGIARPVNHPHVCGFDPRSYNRDEHVLPCRRRLRQLQAVRAGERPRHRSLQPRRNQLHTPGSRAGSSLPCRRESLCYGQRGHVRLYAPDPDRRAGGTEGNASLAYNESGVCRLPIAASAALPESRSRRLSEPRVCGPTPETTSPKITKPGIGFVLAHTEDRAHVSRATLARDWLCFSTVFGSSG